MSKEKRIHTVFAYIADDPSVPLKPFCGKVLSREKFDTHEGEAEPQRECGNCVRTKSYKQHCS